MLRYLFYLVLVASLKNTFSSPSDPFSQDGAWSEEEQEMGKCFIHVKIQSCEEAMNIRLQLEGASPVPLSELDLDIKDEGVEQDVCLPVPCRDGQLAESMKLKVTSVAGSSLDINVSPETLDSTFGGLHEDSEDCFGDMTTPADVNIICKEQSPAADSVGDAGELTNVSLQSFEDEDEDDEEDSVGDAGELTDVSLQSFEDEDEDDEEVHSQNYKNSEEYNNEYDQALSFSCGSHKALKSMKSKHSNRKEDRQFGFRCRKVTSCTKPFQSCYWTGYVNRWRKQFTFTCKQNYVLTGMYSYHKNRKKDRRWRFQCCKAKNFITKSCSSTDYLNRYDKFFSFDAKHRYFIGVHSHFCKRKGDRRFKIYTCAYERKKRKHIWEKP